MRWMLPILTCLLAPCVAASPQPEGRTPTPATPAAAAPPPMPVPNVPVPVTVPVPDRRAPNPQPTPAPEGRTPTPATPAPAAPPPMPVPNVPVPVTVPVPDRRAPDPQPTPAPEGRTHPADGQTSPLQTADLAFHVSRSAQSAGIRAAQQHPASHVGILVVTDGQVHVLEAVGPVKLTPWATFVARGEHGAVAVRRDPRLTPTQRDAVVAAARRDLGKPYDLYFLDDPARIYCSELVHRAWSTVGLDIGQVQTGADLHLTAPAARALLARRWRRHPLCHDAPTLDACAPRIDAQRIVTPASLYLDPRLTPVTGTLPP